MACNVRLSRELGNSQSRFFLFSASRNACERLFFRQITRGDFVFLKVVEERKKMNVPERIGEVFMSDVSDDEGWFVVVVVCLLCQTQTRKLHPH